MTGGSHGAAPDLTNSTNRAAVMKTVSLYDAETDLSHLVEQAAAGEEIVITKAGRPRARLVPFHPDDRPW